MHITNDAMVNTAALTAALDVHHGDLLARWGDGCVELYQEIGEWADVVTKEEEYLSEAIDRYDDGWPGVFAYEVTEEVGMEIRRAILAGHEVCNTRVQRKTREYIQAFCRNCDNEGVVAYYLALSKGEINGEDD